MIIEIIGLGWFANLFVKFWIDRLWKYPNLRSVKPFSCQMCMGFWMGFAYYHSQPIQQMIILGGICSLSTVGLNSIINKLNEPNH